MRCRAPLLAFLAVAMFASFMSTQDSYLFCWASILSRDVLGPLFDTVDSERAQKLGTRLLIVVIAGYELYWGLIYEGREDVWGLPGRVRLDLFLLRHRAAGRRVILEGRDPARGAVGAPFLGFSAILGLAPLKAALGLEAISGPVIGFAAIGLSILGLVVGSLSERKGA